MKSALPRSQSKTRKFRLKFEQSGNHEGGNFFKSRCLCVFLVTVFIIALTAYIKQVQKLFGSYRPSSSSLSSFAESSPLDVGGEYDNSFQLQMEDIRQNNQKHNLRNVAKSSNPNPNSPSSLSRPQCTVCEVPEDYREEGCADEMVRLRKLYTDTGSDQAHISHNDAIWDLPNTTIIFTFCNEPFQSLFYSIHSVLERSPQNLIHEIILVDDGSKDVEYMTELEERIVDLPKVKLLRLGRRAGVYVCMYVYIYIYIYIYMCVCVCVRLSLSFCIYIYIYIISYTLLILFIGTYIYIYI